LIKLRISTDFESQGDLIRLSSFIYKEYGNKNFESIGKDLIKFLSESRDNIVMVEGLDG